MFEPVYELVAQNAEYDRKAANVSVAKDRHANCKPDDSPKPVYRDEYGYLCSRCTYEKL